jgi:WD40 repeat protein
MPGGGNPVAGQPRPQQPVTKEVMAQPDSHALCLAISPDSKTLAAGCTDRAIRLIDARSGEKRGILTGVARGHVSRIAFTPDGKTVVGVSYLDNRLRLWDVASGKVLKALPAVRDKEEGGLPPIMPDSLALSPDGGLIAVGGSGTADGSGVIRLDDNSFFEIRVLDGKTGEPVWTHVGRRGFMHQLAFSPDGRTLAGDTSGDVKLWDARSGELKQSLKPKVGTVWALAFSPDNRLLAGCGAALVEERRSRWLTLWDLRSGAIVHSIEAGDAGGATAPGTLAFSPDGKSLASAGVGIAAGRISIGGGQVAFGQKVINDVKLWDVATGALKWTSPEGDLGNVGSLVFSPDGEALFCCDDSATSRIDARTGQNRRDLMHANEGRLR